jgi:citrate lyase subunit beta/citryl-CoA lyase
VVFVDRLVSMAEEAMGLGRRARLELLIETAPGLQNIGDLARASPRTEALILGPADLSASLGLPRMVAGADYPGDPWHWVRGTILVAARAAGLQAIDGPHLDVADGEGLRRRGRSGTTASGSCTLFSSIR